MKLEEFQERRLASIRGASIGPTSYVIWTIIISVVGYYWLILPHVPLLLLQHGVGFVTVAIWAALFAVPAFYVGRAIRDEQVKAEIERSKCPHCGTVLSETQLLSDEEEIVATTPKTITRRDNQGKVTEEHWTDVRYKYHRVYQRACCDVIDHHSGIETRKEDVQRHRV